MLLYLVIPFGFLVTATNGVLFGCLKKPCEQICENVFLSVLGYECRCYSGYSKDPLNFKKCIPNRPSCGSGFRSSFSPPYECVDIDECNEETSPCQQLCQNSKGSYECSCRSGYVISSRDPTKCERPVDKNCQKGFQRNPRNPASCIDIDECAENPTPCQQLCVNSKGSYECKCRPGYQINEADPNRCDIINNCRKGFRPNPENPTECLDINECAKNPPCEQLCVNSKGSYECKCKPGFRINEADPARCDIVDNCQAGFRPNLTDPTQCLDVDECSEGSPCEQICTNAKGSFRCSCREGFKVRADDAARCEEADPCKQGRQCEQICAVIPGGRKCSCRPGYVISKEDSFLCDEVDECATNNPCEQVCKNTDGSFACSCREGFKVSAVNSAKCEAIDKCKNQPCEQVCTSTDSGYKCSCRPGYAVITSDPSKCDDVDECSPNSPCEQVCTNTAGSYSCSCRSGFKVSATDSTKCESVDRCSNNPCEQNCTSTSSGFECSCKKGYVVSKSDPTKCEDVNECLAAVNPCDQNCTNVRGNFRCSCSDGFVVDPGNKRKCIKEEADPCKEGRQCEQICTRIPGGRKCSCRPGYVISEEDSFLCDEVEVCTAKADIILIFDASNSIGDENFHKQFDFAKRLAGNFKIGPNDVRIGGVVFSRYAEVLFNLKDNDNIEGINKALSNVKYMNSSTYTHEAFNLTYTQQLFSSAKGGRGDAKDVIALFTDGDPVSETRALATAQTLKDNGVLIFSIGIGKAIKLDFLQKVSSTPEDALEATSYDTLEYIEKRLTRLLCEAAESS